MTDDELFELYTKVQREYRNYVSVKTGDAEARGLRISPAAVDAARNDWLVWQAELSQAATPDEIRQMLNRRALESRKVVRRG